jgi:hypothetical protein
VADKYTSLYAKVPSALTKPWTGTGYKPDYGLLRKLIEVPVGSGDAFNPQTGALAAALNVWIATELRRSGVDADRVWPRVEQPRALAWDAAAAASSVKLRKDPSRLKATWGISAGVTKHDLKVIQGRAIKALLDEIGKGPAIPPDPATGHRKNPANIVGAHFPKEIDVSMARYDRGLELGISTKTMIREPTKNIPNRREEASGDLLNIRRRFPLSVFGYFFLLEHQIAKTTGHFDKVADMCRKVALSTPGDEANSYDASCLLVVGLQKRPAKVTLHTGMVPADLRPDRFFETMLDSLMERSQSDDHRTARGLWEAAGRAP